VSTEKPSSLGKRKLIKQNPFERLAQRTVDVGEEALKEARLIDIERIFPNPQQPRRRPNNARLEELAQDIQQRGILQPLLVRPYEEGYQIVAGERRYRAAKKIGLEQVPVIIRELDDTEAQIVSLVENIQREDLDIEDEARYFSILQHQHDYSLRDIAALINKSKSYVDARVRLLKRPEILAAVRDEKLGLHEATLLTRMDLVVDTDGELVQKAVREKDRNQPVREKDNTKLQREKQYNNYILLKALRQSVDLLKNGRKRIISDTVDEEREAIAEALRQLQFEIKAILIKLDDEAHIPEEYKGKVKKL
jgi:ParB family transcriptional regulator, chromosome partitioning protein